MHARTQTPQPTQPSTLMTGWPSSSIASAEAPYRAGIGTDPAGLALEGDAALRERAPESQDDSRSSPPMGG
jgi:hypothetical protein